MVTQSQIEAGVFVAENYIIRAVLAAAVQDSRGNWEQAECLLWQAIEYDNQIGILESTCEEPDINENMAAVCTGLIGIGEWQIEVSPAGCAVMSVAVGQGPPPYGVFKQGEFVVNNFTKVIN